MNDIKIIRASIEQLPQLAPLFDAYRVFYKQPSDMKKSQDFLYQRLTRGDSVLFLAECNNGKGVGFAQLFPTFSSIAVSNAWILNDLYVTPDKRRQGIAKALIEKAHDYTQQHGACKIELKTAPDNTDAQKLYESIGYQKDTFTHYLYRF